MLLKHGLEEIIAKEGKRNILLLGIGGGGDIVSTVPLARYLRFLGAQILFGAVAWERSIIDPTPGPLHLKDFENIEIVASNIGLIRGKVKARGIIPQVSRFSKITGEPVFIVDIWNGVKGVIKGLNEIIEKYNIDVVVGVDVGGDVLAEGFEKELRSPLADQVMLAALSKINAHSFIAVAGLGADGELPLNTLLKRVALIAKNKGLVGARGLTQADVVELSKIVSHVKTEASKIPILAFSGFIGETTIRSGSRKVEVNPILTLTFIFDTKVVYSLSKLAPRIVNTESLIEANKILNNLGIFTELDLEIKLRNSTIVNKT